MSIDHQKNNQGVMRAIVITGLLCSLIGIGIGYLLFGGSDTGEQEFKPIGKPVITINDESVTYAETRQYLEQRLRVSNLNQSRVEEGINEIIVSELLYQEAVAKDLHRDPNTKQIIRRLLSDELLKKQIARQLSATPVKETEAREYYETHKAQFQRSRQVRLADVFIAVDSQSSPAEKAQKRNKAEEVLKRAKALEGQRSGFGTLIRRFSDKHPAYVLGSTGYFGEDGQPIGIEQQVVKAAFSLQKMGTVYPDLIETEKGFHIIMLVGKRPPLHRSFETVKSQIERKVSQEKRRHIKNILVEKLKAESDIHIDSDLAENLLADLKKGLKNPKPFPTPDDKN